MKSIRFAAVFFLLSASAGFGQVRTWVSPAGLDSNPCTREQPCRNFAAAITAVAAGGEVVALESAGYGPVTITKSVTIVAPAGVHAAIAPSSGNAITVSAADTDHVVLRNLYLNSQGATYGIDANMLATLYIERCVISGFSGWGIRFDPSTFDARLYVSDTTVRRCGAAGIHVEGGGSGGNRTTLDSVRLHENSTGASFNLAEATIRNSVASGGAGAGFWASTSAKVVIEDTVAASHWRGFYATSAGVIMVSRSAAISNTSHGVIAVDSGSTIYVSDSTIAANAMGVEGQSGGVVRSRGNNTLQANTTNGAFTSTFTPN
jgi:hypothetical protein